MPVGRSPEPATGQAADADPIRVLIVDDSAVVRGLMTRVLEAQPGIAVVASAGDGKMALNALSRHLIDVVVLDIEMPVMDGLAALPLMLDIDPDLKVVVASTLSHHDAATSVRAMEAGAADFLQKPTTRSDIGPGRDFGNELVAKVLALGDARRHGVGRLAAAPLPPNPAPASPAPASSAPTVERPSLPGRGSAADAPRPADPPPRSASGAASARAPRGDIILRQPGRRHPALLAIGSSTGGPQALIDVIRAIKGSIQLPILITQHMPPTFTTIMADHLARVSGWPCHEGKDGETIEGRHIYVAPGDNHMVVEGDRHNQKIKLLQTPPENFCRPAVDPMLRSVAAVYGGHVLTVILTGMGQDGLKGCQAIVDAGGTLIAQDEASSVVWGMPGAVATAGLCSAVLPVSELGAYINRFVLSDAA